MDKVEPYEIRWKNAIPPTLPSGGYEMKYGENWINITNEEAKAISNQELVYWD